MGIFSERKSKELSKETDSRVKCSWWYYPKSNEVVLECKIGRKDMKVRSKSFFVFESIFDKKTYVLYNSSASQSEGKEDDRISFSVGVIDLKKQDKKVLIVPITNETVKDMVGMEVFLYLSRES